MHFSPAVWATQIWFVCWRPRRDLTCARTLPLHPNPGNPSHLVQTLPTWETREDVSRWELLGYSSCSKFWMVKMDSPLHLKGTYLIYSNLCAKYGGWNCMSNIEVEFMKVCPSSVSFFFLLYYLTDRWENTRKQGGSIAYRAFLVCTAFSLGKYLCTLITSPLNLSFYH